MRQPRRHGGACRERDRSDLSLRSTGLAQHFPRTETLSLTGFSVLTETSLRKLRAICMMGHTTAASPRQLGPEDVIRGSDDPAGLMKLSQTGTRGSRASSNLRQ